MSGVGRPGGGVPCSSRGFSPGAKVAAGGCPHSCGGGFYCQGRGGLVTASGGRLGVWLLPGLSPVGSTSA